MKLLTKELEKRFSQVGNQDGKGDDAIIIAKYFTPFSNWTWYATEYDPETKTFFGLVEGLETEFGYFSLEEFEEINGKQPLNIIERDMYFTEKTIGQIKKEKRVA